MCNSNFVGKLYTKEGLMYYVKTQAEFPFVLYMRYPRTYFKVYFVFRQDITFLQRIKVVEIHLWHLGECIMGNSIPKWGSYWQCLTQFVRKSPSLKGGDTPAREITLHSRLPSIKAGGFIYLSIWGTQIPMLNYYITQCPYST